MEWFSEESCCNPHLAQVALQAREKLHVIRDVNANDNFGGIEEQNVTMSEQASRLLDNSLVHVKVVSDFTQPPSLRLADHPDSGPWQI